MSTHASALDYRQARPGAGRRWVAASAALAVTLAAGVAAGRATAPGPAPAAAPQVVERVLPDYGTGPGFPGPSQRAIQRGIFHGRSAPAG
jgi:hypothetical protein